MEGSAQHLRISKANTCNTQSVNHPGKGSMRSGSYGSHKIVIRSLPKSLHCNDRLLMAVQMKNIRILMNKASRNKFFQRRLGKPVNIQCIPADQQGKAFDLLCLTFRIGTIQRAHIIYLADLRLSLADRTLFRNPYRSASCQVLRNLRNNHIGLIDRDRIPLSQL